MFNILLWQSMRRVMVGLALAFLTGLLLPSELAARLWMGACCTLLLPLMVIGRRRLLNRTIYARMLASSPYRRRWQLGSLSPAFFIILLWSVMIAQGHLKLTLIYFTWGLCCVCIADLFDQWQSHLGGAWAYSILSITLLLTAPFWGALWFGRSIFSPWIASLCLGLHPTFMGLKATGQVTLQNPLLYQLTQSGLVEVYVLPWWIGLIVYLLISCICIELNIRKPVWRHD